MSSLSQECTQQASATTRFVGALNKKIVAGTLALSVLLAGCATTGEEAGAPAAEPAVVDASEPVEVVEAVNAEQVGLTPEEVGFYEVRIYTAAEGKMGELHARFRDHTVGLFKKHGMLPILFASPVVQEGQAPDNRLIYLMGYKDRAARDASWRAFATDPEWTAVYRASQANGSLTSGIENYFVTATDYSPALTMDVSDTPRTFELRTYTAAEGKLENIHTRFRDHTMGIFETHNMTNMLYWRPDASQTDMADQMVYLLSFPGSAARNASWRAFATDPVWQKVARESQVDGALLAGAPASILMRPTDYSPVK